VAVPTPARLTAAIEGYASYEPQTTCDPTAKPGVIAFRDLMLRTYPLSRNLGIIRGCSVGGRSEHKEGRAFDLGVRTTAAAERAVADQFLGWLLATDEFGNAHANLRRLGVMYAIWDHRIFSASRAGDGWRPYSGPSAHTDHVHISFSRAGAAGRTSFWTGVPAPPPSGPAPGTIRGGSSNAPGGSPPRSPRPPRQPRQSTPPTTVAPQPVDHTIVASVGRYGVWFEIQPRRSIVEAVISIDGQRVIVGRAGRVSKSSLEPGRHVAQATVIRGVGDPEHLRTEFTIEAAPPTTTTTVPRTTTTRVPRPTTTTALRATTTTAPRVTTTTAPRSTTTTVPRSTTTTMPRPTTTTTTSSTTTTTPRAP
jgi:hypothetical protein